MNESEKICSNKEPKTIDDYSDILEADIRSRPGSKYHQTTRYFAPLIMGVLARYPTPIRRIVILEVIKSLNHPYMPKLKNPDKMLDRTLTKLIHAGIVIKEGTLRKTYYKLAFPIYTERKHVVIVELDDVEPLIERLKDFRSVALQKGRPELIQLLREALMKLQFTIEKQYSQSNDENKNETYGEILTLIDDLGKTYDEYARGLEIRKEESWIFSKLLHLLEEINPQDW